MALLETISRARPPKSSRVLFVLLVFCATVTSATFGFDGSMMNGLNILPSYTEYFQVTTTTTSLSTSAIYIGGFLAGLTYPKVLNMTSRRAAMLWAALMTLAFIAIQAASQNIAMFTVARIGLGYGKACTALVTPTYLAEVFPYKYRGWGLGLVCDFYYVGALVAAGVTYRTADFNSTWAWRLPSLLQGFWSLLCIVILPFVPESPRWYIFQGRNEEGLKSLAQLCANGDESNAIVQAQFQEIVDTIAFEKTNEDQRLSVRSSFKTVFTSSGARKRLSIVMSLALSTVIVGNSIASYYLGSMLESAGITSATTQLQINIILNAWCLVCCLVGTYFCNSIGRRPNMMISMLLLTICLYVVGAFTKLYGNTTNKSGLYGTVAWIFLYMGAYSFGITPLTYLYPPEVLNYSLRSFGMGVNLMSMYGFGLIFVFAIPFALEAMGWKFYMANASWNIVLIIFVFFFWVETKGKTLEEIDICFDGEKHSDVIGISHLEDKLANIGTVIVNVDSRDV